MRRRFLLAALACTALVIGAYWNSLDNDFHFDDSHVVVNNLYVRSLRNVPRFFTDATTFSSIRSHASYRPLVSLTLAVDYARGGLDPRPYHHTQIALLLALGALLTAFYGRLLRDAGAESAEWMALFAATLFAVHTANTETMNLISARSEELSVIGVVGSFLVWLAWPRLRQTGLHLVPMAIGALAKVHAVMYGPLLFAGVWVWQPDTTGVVERTRQAMRAAGSAIAAGVVVFLFVRGMDAPEWTAGGAARLPYLWTQPYIWLHYARLFLVPVGLTADSDWVVFPTWHDPGAWAGYAFIGLLLLVFAGTCRRRATAPVAFGVAWFALSLIPTSSVIPFAEIVNEHRLFFPFVGLTLAAAGAAGLALSRIAAPSRRRLIGAGLAAALLVGHAAGTHIRNRVWRDDASLWLDVTRKSPGNARGLMNYGLTLMQRGDAGHARDYFERAASIAPGYSTLEINLGIVYGLLERPAVAEAHFKRALALAPDADGHFYYARWLARAGRAPEALPHLEQAIAISPGFLDARHLLMRLCAAADDDAALRRAAADTLALDPNDSDAAAYLHGASPLRTSTQIAAAMGLEALRARHPDDAAEWFRAIVASDPRSADGWNNRGWAQYQLGFVAAARLSYVHALQIDPAHERARNNLALIVLPHK